MGGTRCWEHWLPVLLEFSRFHPCLPRTTRAHCCHILGTSRMECGRKGLFLKEQGEQALGDFRVQLLSDAILNFYKCISSVVR